MNMFKIGVETEQLLEMISIVLWYINDFFRLNAQFVKNKRMKKPSLDLFTFHFAILRND
jgi:hypothetical protein